MLLFAEKHESVFIYLMNDNVDPDKMAQYESCYLDLH